MIRLFIFKTKAVNFQDHTTVVGNTTVYLTITLNLLTVWSLNSTLVWSPWNHWEYDSEYIELWEIHEKAPIFVVCNFQIHEKRFVRTLPLQCPYYSRFQHYCELCVFWRHLGSLQPHVRIAATSIRRLSGNSLSDSGTRYIPREKCPLGQGHRVV